MELSTKAMLLSDLGSELISNISEILDDRTVPVSIKIEAIKSSLSSFENKKIQLFGDYILL